MDSGKIFRRVASTLFVVSIMLFASVAHAEIRTYEGFGEYFVKDDESIDAAKNQAELIAQRDALEQVKFYIKSTSKSVNSRLLEDEIIVIAAGILHVTNTKFDIEVADSLIVKSFVTAEIDIDELEKLLEQAIKKRKGK